MNLSLKNSTLKFALAAALWLFVIGLIRCIVSPYTLDMDGAEQLYQSQWLELGFGIQPPLPTWLLNVLFEFIGRSVAAVQAVRLGAIFFIYLGIFRLSRKLLKSEKLALSCTLSLVFVMQFSSVMLQQQHTVFVTLAVIYGWLSILRIHETGRLQSYLWLGIWVGVGLLSKYNFLVHIAGLLIATGSIAEFRSKLLNPKILLSVLVAAMISAPHYTWILGNFEYVSSGVHSDLAMQQLSMLETLAKGMGAFVLTSLTFGGILFLVFLAFFFPAFKSKDGESRGLYFTLIGRYMIISLFALVAIVVFSQATVFNEHWLQPFFILFPIFLFQKLQGWEVDWSKRFKAFNYLCLFVFLAISVNFSFKAPLRMLTGKPNAVFNVPYKDIAEAIEGHVPECEIILAKDVRTAGHLKMLLPDKLVLDQYDIEHVSLEEETMMKASNMIFIWKVTNESIPLTTKYMYEAFEADVTFAFDGYWTKQLHYNWTRDRFYEIGISRLTIEEK